MRIPEEYLNQLRSAGLLVSAPLPDKHVTPSCVRVAKPAHIPGNGLPERARTWGPFGDVVVDTPLLDFFHKEGTWHVVGHDYWPGPGPGDFHDEWSTPEDAIADILAFFFGDPARMNAKSKESRTSASRKTVR